MPYARRRYGRRYRRYRKSSLSNYSIATRTGARAQSRQIYGLKKRINSIERRTKPEIDTFMPNIPQVIPAGSSFGSYAYQFVAIPVNTNELKGEFARLLNATVYFSAGYSTIANTNQPVTFRVVVFQLKNTRSDEPGLNDIWPNSNITQGSITNDIASSLINGPLNTGVSRVVKILSDRKYYLSFQRPQIIAKIKLNRLYNYLKAANEAQAKGNIGFSIIAYQNTTSSNYFFDVNLKTAYTDA